MVLLDNGRHTAVMPGRVKYFVSGCSNSWYTTKENDKASELSFRRSPSNKQLVERYEKVLKTTFSNIQIVRICEAHFKNGRREIRKGMPQKLKDLFSSLSPEMNILKHTNKDF